MKYVVRSLLLSVLSVAALGCDKATPTAPSGSTLSISASPARIPLNGTSTITVIGREPNGGPLRQGAEIYLATSLGSIDQLVLVDRDGIARATLRGDGRSGTATVTAGTGPVSGGGGGSGGGGSAGTGGGGSAGTAGTSGLTSTTLEASVSVSTTVQIGESNDTKPTLLISANPNVIPVGGSAIVTIIARNSDGSPVASGQEILLTTTLGTLQPRRPTTNSNGVATSTLTVDSQAGTAKVTAVLGNSNAESTEIQVKDATLTLTANPASVDEGTRNTITLTAVLTNFQGGGVAGKTITFSAQRGTLSSSTAVTQGNGEASVELTLEPQQVSTNETFTVTATTPSSSGESLTATVTITIRFVPS